MQHQSTHARDVTQAKLSNLSNLPGTSRLLIIYNCLQDFKRKFIAPTDRELLYAIETGLKTCNYKTLVDFASKLKIDTNNMFGFQKTHHALLIDIIDFIFREMHSHNLNWKIQAGIAGSVKIIVWLIQILLLKRHEIHDQKDVQSNKDQQSRRWSLQVLICDALLHFGVFQIAIFFYKWMRNSEMRRQIVMFLENAKESSGGVGDNHDKSKSKRSAAVKKHRAT